ncbi:MAG TPA: sulfatase-like hydrolase/transferase [Bryobacteraceae bacterium]|nr:sulfatase-like hydrolase/transferase [Bryobacteraceae bacterium]
MLLLETISRAPSRVARALRYGVLLLVLIALNAFREVASQYQPYLRGPLIRVLGESGVLWAALVLGAITVTVLVVWHSALYRLVMRGLLVLSLFVPVTVGQAVWKASNYDDSRFLDGPPAPHLDISARPDPHIVWIIFDEFDQRLAFEDRPKGFQLPELDRLRDTSIYATHAYPPSSATMISLPSLITGRRIAETRVVNGRELDIQYDGSPSMVNWTTEPNVFSRTRALGFNTGLVGWYHPYCRILNNDLTSCYWNEIELASNSNGRQFTQVLPNQLRSLLETSIYSPFGRSLVTKKRALNYMNTIDAARRLVADDSISLCFLHLQPPHTPQAFNRRTGKFDLGNSSVSGYLDGLALADHTLAQLRLSMEQAGNWMNTTVVVSSDHWFRDAKVFDGKLDHRVPFLIKLPGQTTPLSYGARFNTVITQELLLDILRGKVVSTSDTVKWLNLHQHDAGNNPQS